MSEKNQDTPKKPASKTTKAKPKKSASKKSASKKSNSKKTVGSGASGAKKGSAGNSGKNMNFYWIYAVVGVMLLGMIMLNSDGGGKEIQFSELCHIYHLAP